MYVWTTSVIFGWCMLLYCKITRFIDYELVLIQRLQGIRNEHLNWTTTITYDHNVPTNARQGRFEVDYELFYLSLRAVRQWTVIVVAKIPVQIYNAAKLSYSKIWRLRYMSKIWVREFEGWGMRGDGWRGGTVWRPSKHCWLLKTEIWGMRDR